MIARDIALIASALLLAGCGSTNLPGAVVSGDPSKMAISEDGGYPATAYVGKPTDFDLTIKNVGPVDIPNVAVLFDDGDKFLDNYTVVSSGSCKVNKDLPGLACGPLAKYADLKFKMTAEPRMAGNFTFKFHIGNDKRWLNDANGKLVSYSWQQTILS